MNKGLLSASPSATPSYPTKYPYKVINHNYVFCQGDAGKLLIATDVSAIGYPVWTFLTNALTPLPIGTTFYLMVLGSAAQKVSIFVPDTTDQFKAGQSRASSIFAQFYTFELWGPAGFASVTKMPTAVSPNVKDRSDTWVWQGVSMT